MRSEGLLPIGRFARLSGVSVHALRHYDDVGLLVPAAVEPASGYRRYLADQIRQARLIRALRWTDLPIDEIRQIMRANSDDDIRPLLARHRDRLERQRSRLDAQLKDVTRFLERGLTMPTLQSGCRPVQIMIAVQDKKASVGLYQALLGTRYDVAQRAEHADYSSFIFGEYGQGDFFLLWLLDDAGRLDLPGKSTLSFSVGDLNATHQRALAAGATEAVAPHDAEGMPRNSAVTDRDGNWIGLFEGDGASRPVQLKLAVDDAQAATVFYQEAFGLSYQVTRRTSEQDYSSFMFGEYGRDDFFLLWLLDDAGRLDRPGPANLSFIVDDLDAVHQRAIAAGATEMSAPHDTQGMPRNSAVKDPSGNWIGLIQA